MGILHNSVTQLYVSNVQLVIIYGLIAIYEPTNAQLTIAITVIVRIIQISARELIMIQKIIISEVIMTNVLRQRIMIGLMIAQNNVLPEVEDDQAEVVMDQE